MKLYKVNYKHVPIEKINRLTRKNHQGVFAFISPISFHKTDRIVQDVFEKGETPLFLILDRITDVRNFGAIVRSAECAGGGSSGRFALCEDFVGVKNAESNDDIWSL